jgi:YYY domain-containing protein
MLVPQTRFSAYLFPVPVAWERALGSWPMALLLGGGVVGAGFLLVHYETRGAIVFLACAAAAVAVAFWRRADRALHAALIGVALFATLIPEMVTLQGDIGRMNTVFKFYLQAWVMLATMGAVALGWLARRQVRRGVPLLVRSAWYAVAAILVVAAVSYPLLASQAKLGARFAPLPPSIDGMAYMDVAQYSDRDRDLNLPGDAQAIRWLRQNVTGSPVILEGRSPLYRWGSRVSIYTGLPTVLGWDWHQTQQRSAYANLIQERVNDVQLAYDSARPTDALDVIHKYGIKWVYVGGLESAYYSPAGLQKLATMPELRLAYDADGVRIYEVMS